jgi:hypothetical protein
MEEPSEEERIKEQADSFWASSPKMPQPQGLFAQCKALQQRIQEAQMLDAQAEQLPQELDAAFARNDYARCEELEPKIAAVNAKIAYTIHVIVTTGMQGTHT